jgi:hypothetical protein
MENLFIYIELLNTYIEEWNKMSMLFIFFTIIQKYKASSDTICIQYYMSCTIIDYCSFIFYHSDLNLYPWNLIFNFSK